jgi:glucokinase
MGYGVFNAADPCPSRPGDLRLQNCRTLLRLLRAHSPCSKADLARYSGLSAPTVTAVVSALADLGLVEAVGEGPTSGGRPPEMLRFCSEHRFVAGADIGGTRLRMMLADLGGKPVAQFRVKLSPGEKDPASVCGLVHEGLLRMLSDAGVALDRVLEIAIGAPGVTDVERGIVLSAPNLTGWVDVPLAGMFEKRAGVPAVTENDVNLAALGEHWRGAAAGVDDFLFVAIGTGIGAGVFVKGQLYQGARWSAGEIGYLGVPGLPREPVDLEKPGQLERVVGGAGIEQLWREQLRKSGRAEETPLTGLRGSEIFDRVQEHSDPDAIAVLRYAARVLADALATVSLVFNPGLIVLGGGLGAHPCLQKEIERELAGSNFPHPTVRTSLLGTEAQLFGAVALALSTVETRLVC